MKEVNNQNLFAVPKTAQQLDTDGAQVDAKLPSIHEGGVLVPSEKHKTLDDETTVEVRFCTGGRLSAPPVLHFRDYSMLASQALAELPTAADYMPIIVRVLNSMVVEDFDCGLLHVEEAKEVLLNVYAKWWGNTLTDYKYLLNPDIEDEEKLLANENISVADIPIASIAANIKPLDKDIVEPINVKARGTTVRFVYPRIRNSGIVTDLLKEKFAVEEQRFVHIKQVMEFNAKQEDPDEKKPVDYKELSEYQEYLAEKEKWKLIYTRAQQVAGIDDEVIDDFDARVDAVMKDGRITVWHWKMYTDFLDDKGAFGIKDEATFYSDVLGKEITRPFRFHTWDFIPNDSMERTGDVDGEISFG